MPNTTSLLSIVIATYTTDRLQDLKDLIQSVDLQTYSPIEVVLIVEKDRGLYDTIRDPKWISHRVPIRLFFNEKGGGLSVHRNMGIEKAKGDILAFVDDDVVLAPDWSTEVVAVFSDKAAFGMTGPAYPLWQNQSMKWIPEEFHWLISCTSWVPGKELRPIRNAWGHNMAFRKSVFEAAGLFETSVGLQGLGGPVAEDTEFSMRAAAKTGLLLMYNPKAIVWHKVRGYRLSWSYVAQRSYWIGRSRHIAGAQKNRTKGQAALAPEMNLLKNILLRVPLRVARNVVHPVTAWRQASLTVWSLGFVGAGYISGFRLFGGRRRKLQGN